MWLLNSIYFVISAIVFFFVNIPSFIIGYIMYMETLLAVVILWLFFFFFNLLNTAKYFSFDKTYQFVQCSFHRRLLHVHWDISTHKNGQQSPADKPWPPTDRGTLPQLLLPHAGYRHRDPERLQAPAEPERVSYLVHLGQQGRSVEYCTSHFEQ